MITHKPNYSPVRKAALGVVFLIALVMSSLYLLRPVGDPDFFWHLKNGEVIWQNKSLPAEDPFSYTMQGVSTRREHAVLTSYFLSQLAYYLAYAAGGMTGIVALRFVLVALLVCVLIKRQEGDSVLNAGLILIFLALFLTLYSVERPQFFSFLFFGILLFILDGIKNNRFVSSKTICAAILVSLLMILWANTHQGFVLGQVTILLYIVTEGLKYFSPRLRPLHREGYLRLTIAGISGILCSFVNPNTYRVWPELVFQPNLTIIDNIEYQSSVNAFMLFNQQGVILYWLLLLLAIIGIFITARKSDITDIALVVGTGLFSFFTYRYIAIFAIAALPVIGRGFAGWRWSRIGTPLILVISVVASLFFSRDAASNIKNLTSTSWIDGAYPSNAADFIVKNNLSGNMFNYYNWGGYMIWRLSPQRKVFVDGRCLSPDIVKKSILIETAYNREVGGIPAWKALLRMYDVEYAVIPFAQPDGTLLPLVIALNKDREWYPVFLHLNSIIFVHDSPVNHGLILNYAIPKDHLVALMIRICDEFIRSYPDDIFPLITKGDLYLSMFRLEEARASYGKATAINPFNATARERLHLLSRLSQRERIGQTAP